MSDPILPSGATVEANPKKPWKAYAALALSFLGLLWVNLKGRETLGGMDLMDWLSIIIPAILTAGGTYLVRNPKVIDYKNGGGL